MKKLVAYGSLIVASLLLVACTNDTNSVESVTLDNYGDKIIFTPSEEDWCGENCIIYPETGTEFIRLQETGDDTFYPEGTDR